MDLRVQLLTLIIVSLLPTADEHLSRDVLMDCVNPAFRNRSIYTLLAQNHSISSQLVILTAAEHLS